MRVRSLGRPAGALFALFACFAAAPPRATVAANNQTTPFTKLPRLFFGETPAPMLPATAVLSHYESAIENAKSPRFVTFSFSIEQVGPHILSQSHHVYRDGLNERDETTYLDGKALPSPLVRIFRNHSNHYDLGTVAPRTDDYDFKLTGTQHDGDHDDYLFDTTSHRDRAFAVSSVVIDGARFLPIELAFHIDGGAMRGQGRLLYGPVDRYWLVREAEVSAHDGAGVASRERIVWSGYQFPETLPAATFSSRAPAVVEPDAEPAPRPVVSAPGAGNAPAGEPPASSGGAAPASARAVTPPGGAVPRSTPPPKPAALPTAARHVKPPKPLATSEVLEGPVTPAPLREETPLPAAPTSAPATAAAPATPAATALPGAAGPP